MVVVEVGRYGWSKLDQIGRWLVHGRSIVAMVRPSERGTGWASVGEPRDGPASCPPPREVGPQVDTRQRAIQLCRLNCPETPFRSRSGFLWKDALMIADWMFLFAIALVSEIAQILSGG